MSEHTETAPAAAAPAHHTNYVKIWGILLALLVVSVLGPMAEIRWLTLITAFGIALVKAFIVAKYFMHIGMERKWVIYLLLGMLAFMLVMVGGISPDVMKHEGLRWENVATKAEVVRGEKEGTQEHGSGGAHGAEHGAAPVEHAEPAAH
jgi:caa(3)-type oxidase subunit IV